MHRLLAAGRSQAAIATELGLSRNTVRRFARARGYRGGYSIVRDHRARSAETRPCPLRRRDHPSPARSPSWIVTNPDDLDPADQASLDAIVAAPRNWPPSPRTYSLRRELAEAGGFLGAAF